MTAEATHEDTVLALRYDEAAVADELSVWCGGRVERPEGADGGQAAPVVWVPTRHTPRAASIGDWIVRNPDGSFTAMTAEAFAVHFEPSAAVDLSSELDRDTA